MELSRPDLGKVQPPLLAVALQQSSSPFARSIVVGTGLGWSWLCLIVLG